jgi:dTDP-4-dehydrorhamnose reductase
MHFLVTGAGGQLGAYLLRDLAGRGAAVTAWGHAGRGDLFGLPLVPVELTDRAVVAAAFRAARPDAVIHCAALSRVADCHRDPARAEAVNVGVTRLLAELADAARARLVFVSTDLVFDGRCGGYTEENAPAPLSAYGRSKAQAEDAVRSCPRALVARVSLLFGPTLTGRPSFFDEQALALRQRRPCTLFADEWRTPLSLPAAARALVALAEADCTGVLHLGGPERMSRLEMGRRLAASLGADPSMIVAANRDDVPAPEPRPRDTSLDSSRWRGLFPRLPWPTWDEAMREMLQISGGAR